MPTSHDGEVFPDEGAVNAADSSEQPEEETQAAGSSQKYQPKPENDEHLKNKPQNK